VVGNAYVREFGVERGRRGSRAISKGSMRRRSVVVVVEWR
jgi:hypothetical protein